MCCYSSKIICILCMRIFFSKEIVICPRLLELESCFLGYNYYLKITSI